MKKNYTTFNKMLLFTAGAYMENALAEGLTKDPFHRKLASGINSYKTLCKFSAEEFYKVKAFGETEVAKKVVESEFSHIIFALQLLQMWVDEIPHQHRKHIYLGVSNKKLLMGRASFAVDMLELKKRDKEKYDETRAIIDDGVVKGKHFFSQALEYFTNEDM